MLMKFYRFFLLIASFIISNNNFITLYKLSFDEVIKRTSENDVIVKFR
jgi:hypothetical protein